jgi:hypothetical protein
MMFRVIFDREGRSVFDMSVGETDINQGITDSEFEASETAVIYSGFDNSDSVFQKFNGINACVASRNTYGVTQ